MTYSVCLDGYETLSETERGGVRRDVMRTLQDVFGVSTSWAMGLTEGAFPKIIAMGLDRETAEDAVQRLGRCGAYVRAVPEDEPTAWDMIMRD